MAGASREPYLFVSYASADRERVLPVVDRLQHAGVNAWIDREGIHGGANYAQVISDAIKGAAALMLMASPASLASRNVRQELALGWRFERPYLPLLLDRITIPDELAYWLEGSQWIELLDHPEDVWLAGMAQALGHLGIEIRLGAGPVERATPPRERPPLVGREHEQALLSQQLARMLGGRGGVVLIGGEAGIGKSTLVEDLSAQAEESGALVLWGHAYDLSVTPPYGPWVEILRQYPASAPGMPLPPTFVGDAEALAKIGSQETLFAATRDFFQAVAAQRPLVLVLNDLHWADQSTLDFFRFLARQLANQRILLVATYRTDEVNRRHPLHILLPLLVREAGAERLVVRPLDAAGHRALIQSRYALAEADQVRLEDYLEARAEGNPLYAGELLRTLEEERILTRQDDDWVLGDLEQVRVPALLRQVIEGRAARLDEESQRLLGIAAVIGQTAPLVIWAAAGEVDEDSLLELAERAEEAGLLEALPDGDGVRFSHALIRSTLYEVLPPLRRRRLHRQVADVLLALPGPDPDSVAFHLEQSGDARAIDWLIRAGELALRLYAFDAAIAHFSQAESLAARQTAAVPGTLYASRGQAYRLTGQFDAARHDFETVLTLARQSGDPRVEWQADIDLGMLWAARNYARTGEYFQQALALARTMDAPDLTAHALNRVGNWHVNSQQPLNALRHHEEALKIFEQLGDRAGIAITSDLLGLASYLAGDLIQGTMHYRRAVELFREADNREGLSSALAVMSMRGGTFMTDTMVVEQVTLDECVRDAEEAVAIARGIGWLAGESFALAMTSRSLAAGGRYQQSLDMFMRGVAIAERIQHRQWLASSHCAAGTLYFDLLALPEAQLQLEQGLSDARATGSEHWIHCTGGSLASVMLERGDLAGAQTVLDSILDPDTPMQTMGQRLVWCARVRLALLQGDPTYALSLLDRMQAASPNASEGHPIVRLSYLRAEALLQTGEFEAAEAALDAAQGIADRHSARPWQWRIHLTRGLLRQRQDDAEGAAREFALARAIIEDLAANLSDDALRETLLAQSARLFPDS